MALAAVAAGADGITVEVHTDPEKALSDGPQSLYPDQFEKLMRDIEALAPGAGQGAGPASRRRIPTAVHGRHPAITARRGDRAARAAPWSTFQGERGAFGEHAIRHWFAGEVHAAARPGFPIGVRLRAPGTGALRHGAHRELPDRLHPRELRPAPAVPGPADRRRAENPDRAQPHRPAGGGARGHPPRLLPSAGACPVREVPGYPSRLGAGGLLRHGGRRAARGGDGREGERGHCQRGCGAGVRPCPCSARAWRPTSRTTRGSS